MTAYDRSIFLSLGNLPKTPPFKASLAKALMLLNDPRAPIESIEGLFEEDPSLATRLLAYASGSRFDEPARSISEAVQRIGCAATLKLIVETSLKHGSIGDLDTYGLSRSHTIRYFVMSARLAEVFFMAAGRPGGEGYVLGLLRGMGMWAIDFLAKEERCNCFGRADLLFEWEQDRFCGDHLEVSAHLLMRWGLASDLSKTMRCAATESLQACSGHAALLKLAVFATQAAWAGEPSDAWLPYPSSWCWANAGLKPERAARALEALRRASRQENAG